MTTQLFTKQQTQKVIRDLRQAGYTVNKIGMRYECKLDGQLIFEALNGTRAYLVRYDARLLTKA